MSRINCKNFKKIKIMGEKWTINKIINVNCGWIYTLSFNCTNKMFATGSSDNIVRLWSSKSFKNLTSLFGHVGPVKCVIFDEKHNSIFSGGDDLVIKYWDIEYNKNIRNYKGHISSIIKLIKYPILNIILSSSRDNTIRLWDFRMHKEITILSGHKNTVTCLLGNLEKPHIISGSLDNTIRFWDLVANRNFLILKSYQNGIKEMHGFGENGSFITLSPSSLNFYRKDGLLIKKINNFINSFETFSINQKKYMAISYSSGWIKYVNLGCNCCSHYLRPLYNKKKKERILSIGFNLKEDQMLTVGIENTIKVFAKRWFFLNEKKNNY